MKIIKSIFFILFINSAVAQISCDSILNTFTGVCTTSYSDGVIKSTTQYENGVKQGEYREYYHHGELGAKGNFENGHLVEKFERFSPTGSLILAAEINDKGTGEVSEYNFNGAILVHGKFKNWRKSGVWKNLNYKGDVLKKTKFNPSNSSDAATVLIEELGFGNEPEGIIDFPSFETDYIGGQAAMQRFISTNVHYPVKAIEKNISGKVYISFVVEIDGSISNARVMRDVDPLLDAEALRLINLMPAWNPAVQGGMRVRTRARVPINFTLS
ncbi:MAG: hypothetical protein COA38_01615 [Fluviicola sp.]|nr:MAG: hypothetical protein COA38_01615 [Fluviicola sp.]